MSDNKQQFWTVTVSLLIASALISACGTSSGKDITPGPTLTAATLATPTLEPIAAASPVPPPSPGPEIAFPLALGNSRGMKGAQLPKSLPLRGLSLKP